MIEKIKKFFLNTEKNSSAGSRERLSEQDRLVNCYFDGELSSKEADSFKRSNAGVSTDIESRLEELRDLRQVFRDFVQDGVSKTKFGRGEATIWEQIESRIHQEAGGFSKDVGNIGNAKRKIQDWLEPFFAPPVLIGTVACALLAFTFGVRLGSAPTVSNVDSLKPQELASTKSIEIRESAPSQKIPISRLKSRIMEKPVNRISKDARISVVGFGAGVERKPEIRLRVSRELARKRVLEHRVPLILDTNQLIGVSNSSASRLRHPVPGGLRADGADIDWIRSDHDFKLLPVRRKSDPPIIWVSGK